MYLQKALERACLFDRYRRSLGAFVIRFKVMDAGITLKPTPLMRGEMQAVAEDATSGSTTVLYGRVAAFVRALSGARNPTVAAWTWRDVSFVPTVIITKGEGDVEDTHEVWVALLIDTWGPFADFALVPPAVSIWCHARDHSPCASVLGVMCRMVDRGGLGKVINVATLSAESRVT